FRAVRDVPDPAPEDANLPLVEYRVPFLQVRAGLFEKRRGIALDGDRIDGVAAAHGIDDLLVIRTVDHAEHRVLAVQPGRGDMGDEELAAIGARSGIGHRKNAAGVVLEAGHDVVFETVARATRAAAARAPA